MLVITLICRVDGSWQSKQMREWVFEAFFSSCSQAALARSETKGRGGVRYCQEQRGIGFPKKNLNKNELFFFVVHCAFLILYQPTKSFQIFCSLLQWKLRGLLVPEAQYLEPISPNMGKQTKQLKTKTFGVL